MKLLLAATVFAALVIQPALAASPFSAKDEIQQRGGKGGGPGMGGGGRCKPFAKANKCKPRFDSRTKSCVCL